MNEWRIQGDAMLATPHIAGRGLSQLVHTSLAIFDKENGLERDKNQVRLRCHHLPPPPTPPRSPALLRSVRVLSCLPRLVLIASVLRLSV